MSNLEANQRSETSRGSNNSLRKNGLVPAVLYGGEEKNELISVSKKHLKYLLDQENFLSNVLKIKIKDKEINVLPREVSFDVYLRASEKPVLRILKNFRPNYFNEKYLIKDKNGNILKKSESLNSLINKTSWNKLRMIK